MTRPTKIQPNLLFPQLFSLLFTFLTSMSHLSHMTEIMRRHVDVSSNIYIKHEK